MADNKKTTSAPRRGPGPRGFEKPKDFKGTMKKLYSYSKEYMVVTIITLLCAAFGSICSIIGPNKLKDLTDAITSGMINGIDMEKVKSIVLFLAILYIISCILTYLEGFIMATITSSFSKKLRSNISEKINRLPLKYFDNNSIGDVLSRVTNDVDTLGFSLDDSISSLVSAITLLVGTVLMMFITNWQMALTGIFSSLIGFSLMIVILSKSQKYFIQQQTELGNINGHIEEIYSGHNVVKVYNAVDDANEKFDEINNRLYKTGRNSQFLSGLMPPLMGFIGNFGYVAICVVGAILVIDNTISIGVIVAFMIYVRLFTQPLSTIAQCASSLQSGAAAAERIFEFLEEVEMDSEDKLTKHLNKEDVKGNIVFENVNFGYNSNKIIIKNFNANVCAGQKVAIVGPTGAGKTTLVNLLMKFYDVVDGDIKIDGISIKELSRKNIHDLFTMVLQDTWLFNGTIRENIAYNNENIKDDEIIKVCKIVGVDHFIKTLPHNYDTVLSDSESISSGQKQLITIARGMILDTPFLILDEATSSVDTRTEELVQKAMDKLTEGKTSFIIAHRLSTIKNADLILVMNDGNIIEQGNHEELIRKNGFYAELYNSQFEKTE